MAISRLQNDVYTIAFRYKKKKSVIGLFLFSKKFMFFLVWFWWTDCLHRSTKTKSKETAKWTKKAYCLVGFSYVLISIY